MIHRHAAFAGCCVLAVTLLLWAYSNHFDNAFHFDDSHVIVENLSIRGLDEWPRFFADAGTFTSLPQNATYRPLLTLSYALDYRAAGGLVPAQFHRTQFLLLLLLGGLLVALYKRLCDHGGDAPWNRWCALFAATLFCVHTANTQTVNYIASRSDIVSTLGVVAALLVYMAWPRGRWTGLYLLPAIVGGLAKPLAVMFAPILLVFILLFEERLELTARIRRESLPRLLAAFRRSLPAFGVCGLLFVFLSRMDAPTVLYATASRWEYLKTQPFVWLHYVRLFFVPVGLTADADWSLRVPWHDTRVFAGLLLIAGLAAAISRLSMPAPLRPASFGLAWFCLALLPTSSVFPLSETYNEHRVFFPYVGLTIAVCWLAALAAARLPRGRAASLAAILAAVVLGAHAAGTHARNEVWKTEETLWKDVTEKSPGNGRGLMNYGLALMGRGDYAGALHYYNRALLLTPNYPTLEVNLGIVKAAMGDEAEAEAHFRRALTLNPDYVGGHHYYGRFLAQRGRGPEALDRLTRALALSPSDAGARSLAVRLHAASGDEARLEAIAGETLRASPADPIALAYAEGRAPFDVSPDTAEGWRKLGLLKINAKEWLDAAAILRHAVSLDADSAVAWNNLGWARANLGFFDSAVACFEKAFALDPAMAVASNNAAWAKRRAAETRQEAVERNAP